MADRRRNGTASVRTERAGTPAARKKSPTAKSEAQQARGGASKARGSKRAAASATSTSGGARRGAKKATAKRKVTPKRASSRATAKRASAAPAPTRLMRIRELEPRAVCGAGTTVMQLFRVDDLPVGTDTTHLVFLDRHGWYCQHGRECPAVSAVRRHEKQGTLTR